MRIVRPYTRVVYNGKVMNARTRAMVQEAERRLGYSLTITQGSYSTSVGASAGTHNGGGALDLAAYDHKRKVKVLRAIGFAAWYRPAIPGLWGAHIHALAIGDRQLAAAAKRQVQAYYAGRDGLAGNGPDPHPRPNPIPVFQYWRTRKVALPNMRNQFKAKKPQGRWGVRMIQRALNEKIDAGLKVDGVAGEATRKAYRRYEQKLGYKHANSIPGVHSLRRLGAKIFGVTK